MTNQPLVSVIIPTFNRADLIGETLDSIIAQTYQNWECIVVDDGSTDNTAEVLKKYTEKDDRIKYHHRPAPYKAGGNGARNYGFDISKGEYINWFDSDDVMLPKKLELQLNELLINNSIINICQSFQFKDNTQNILKVHDNIYSDNYFYDFLRQKISLLTPTPIFKREVFSLLNDKNRFDEKLKAAQEWEFFCRIFYFFDLGGISFLYEPLVAIRAHEKSISKNSNHEKLYHYYLARQKIRSFLIKLNDFSYESFFEDYNHLYFNQLLRFGEIDNLKKLFRNEKNNFRTLKSVLNPIFFKIFLLTGKGKGKINFNYYKK